jgi:hypothetical protein
VAEYEFLSTWCLAGVSRPDAFEVLRDSVSYPQWWKGVRSAQVVRAGAEHNTGEVVRFAWRSVLPYTLGFDLELTRIEPPEYIEARATGELEGTGIWRLYEGPGVAVVYEWRVRTTKAWMNRLGPLARPAFVWNHDLVMRQGARSFAQRVGAELVVCD